MEIYEVEHRIDALKYPWFVVQRFGLITKPVGHFFTEAGAKRGVKNLEAGREVYEDA